MIRLAFLLWVLAEVAAFVLAGRAVGVLGVIALVLATALAGGMLLRAQGAQALRSLRGGVRRGGDPLALLLRDGFRLVAALLLILPGLVGDLVGLMLLLPPVQARVGAHLARRGLRPANLGAAPRGAARPARPEVVEAEWEELPPPPRASGRPSGWTRD